ncbi:B12-binding domain-containing radical SAM protein [Patescibacteria group bacterium]
MKIVFVAIANENIAIEFLSSFLKEKGHEVEVVFDPRVFATEAFDFKKLAGFFDLSKEIVAQINEKQPDLIGFSVFTFNFQRSLKLAKAIKRSGQKAPIVFGGIHPTSVPERVIKKDSIDIVCVGEGEEALLELLESLEAKKVRTDIANLWFKKGKRVLRNPCRPLVADLDKLPFPDKEIFYRIYPKFIRDDYSAASSRGCPFACTYCGNNVLRKTYQGLGKYLRRRSPKNMVDELVWAKEKFSIKKITFIDDVFGYDYQWLKEFAADYKKRVALPYVMITHPVFMTKPIVKLLVDSGCYFLLFGVQSVSEKTRRDILGRFETNQEIARAARNCHQYKLKFSVDHIFNIPGEGLKEQEKALRFYNRIRPSIINSYWLQYFPRTAIINTAVKKGIIKKKMVAQIEEGKTSTSLVIGLGNKDTFSPERLYANFQFFFMLLPILPKSFTNWVIRKKLYSRSFKPPMLLNAGLKLIINLLNKRGGIYWGIIKGTVYFTMSSLLLKWKYRNHK